MSLKKEHEHLLDDKKLYKISGSNYVRLERLLFFLSMRKTLDDSIYSAFKSLYL